MTLVRPFHTPTFSSHWVAQSRNQESLRDETCFYLGLFSLTPTLLVFQSWAIIPTLVIATMALRKVWLLHQRGVEAVTLNVATWLMLSLNLNLSLLFPPFSSSEALGSYTGMIFSVALSSLVVFPLFALISLFYGMQDQSLSRRKIWGMSFSFVHALIWVVLIVFLSIQGLNP